VPNHFHALPYQQITVVAFG